MASEPPAEPSATSDSPVALKRAEHQMTRLLAMSFDGPASPSLVLKAIKQTEERDMPYGWGMAWYPEQGNCSMVVKDPTSIGENAMTKLLSDWERFESTVFVCHLRGAARSLSEQDTHPFARAYAGRDWVLAHNGDLFADLRAALPLGDDPLFEPNGRTDSEHAFCWLLQQVRARKARRLSEVGWPELYKLFRRFDELGTANFIVSDGIDLVVYGDDEAYNRLFHARFVPPHESLKLDSNDVLIDLDDAVDRARTVSLVGTKPFEGTGSWKPLAPGQMLVLRRGAVIHDSHASEQERRRIVAPVPPPPGSGRVSSLLAPIPAPPSQGPASKPSPRPLPPTRVSEPPARPSRPPASNEPFKMRDPSQRRPGSRVLSIVHETAYRYRAPVERSSHLFRLKPVHDPTQEILEHELSVSIEGLRRDYEDVFGNSVSAIELESPYSELRIISRSLVRLTHAPSPYLHSPKRRMTIPLAWMPWQRQMMHAYLLPVELPETQLRELYTYAMSFVERQDGDLVQTLLDMNQTIYRDFSYVSGSTTLETTPFEVYVTRKGVCQDFANLMICLARLLGIPARYRVGYIHTGANYENKVQSEASHAWLELYLPWMGWQGFDPTNGCLVADDHVRVACGRNFRDATPTSGTLYKGGGGETLSVDVKVIDQV